MHYLILIQIFGALKDWMWVSNPIIKDLFVMNLNSLQPNTKILSSVDPK